MTPGMIGIIGFFALFILLLLRMPIGLGMAAVGFLGFSYLVTPGSALHLLGTIPYSHSASYYFAVLPLFILMGEFAFYGGIAEDAYNAAYKWLGAFPGGLAMATIAGCAGFAACTGSSPAAAATMATVALPQMRLRNYDSSLAAGSIAAGGTMGILIPPSIAFIIYGMLTEQSIGKLFLAGIFPGILEAVFYIGTIYILCTRNKELGPPGPSIPFKDKIVAVKDVWGAMILFLLIMVSLSLGLATSTEVGGIAAIGALLLMINKGRFSWINFRHSIMGAGQLTGMIFLLVIGALIFNSFIAVTELPMDMADFLAQLPIPRYATLVGIIFIYLFLGCIMDSMAMILLTVPIIFPVILALGFDPIWFGVIIVGVMEIACITPPIGINLFVISGVVKDVPLRTIFKGVIPFFIADVFRMSILISFPAISLFLPNLRIR